MAEKENLSNFVDVSINKKKLLKIMDRSTRTRHCAKTFSPDLLVTITSDDDYVCEFLEKRGVKNQKRKV